MTNPLSDMVFDKKIGEYIPREEFEFYSQHEKVIDGDKLTDEQKREYLKISLDNCFFIPDGYFPFNYPLDIRNEDGSLVKKYHIHSVQDYSNCINELIEMDKKYWGHVLEICFHLKKRLMTGEDFPARGEREPIT